MRFGLRCIFWLAILYHAILSGDDGAERTLVRDAAGAARQKIAGSVDAYCRHDPATCLSEAARIGSVFSPAAAAASAASAGPRHRKRGAIDSARP